MVRTVILSKSCSAPARLKRALQIMLQFTNLQTLTFNQLFSSCAKSFEINQLPTFCGTLVGGYTLLQLPLRTLCNICFQSVARNSSQDLTIDKLRRIIPRFLAAFVSAWFSLRLLNIVEAVKIREREHGDEFAQAKRPSFEDTCTQTGKDVKPYGPPFAGTTIDLTLFAFTRAVDTIVVRIWRRHRGSRFRSRQVIPSILSRHTDTLLFALSSGTIMWTWFYLPSRLPKQYNKWIGEVAQVDQRLIKALRKCRAGSFVYGEDKGAPARFLQGMCKEYDWPIEWGDPEKTIPIPCEMVHMGTGPNCHWHALARFGRTFRFAMATNLPLQLLFKGISKRKLTHQALTQACKDAATSSTFLGLFVALMYYGICLSRTCMGPKLFDRETVSPQMWDSGLCVRAACILCGWSVLIEAPKRRQELAMFVAPRALATQLPREYDASHFWRERVAFSLSTAVLFTMAQEDSSAVRGMLGKLLDGILRY